jgi:hypothetical protein
MTDPRAVTEFRVPAIDLEPGDLVNTSPGEDDWQQVLGVYTGPEGTADADVKKLAAELGGRYVIVQLTDIAPVDSGIYFAAGLAMTYGGEDSSDAAVKDVISSDDGVRTYLFTKFELVTIRAR